MASAAASGDKTVSRVALCSAIFAGFAYISYSVVRNAVSRKRRGWRKKYEDDERPTTLRTMGRFNVGSQTDLLLGNLDCSEGGILRPLSVQERIRELNLRARQYGDEGIIIKNSPFFRPRSLQSSPWNSPRILSPVDINHFMSRSAESLNVISPPPSPIFRRKSSHSRRSSPLRQYNGEDQLSSGSYSNNSIEGSGGGGGGSGGSGRLGGATMVHQVTEVHILLKDSEETLKKRLDGLYSKGKIITPYEAQSLVALLYTQDENLLLRVLTTITNCAAFSANQDYLREAGCLPILTNLVSNIHCSHQIYLAAIQGIGNLSLNKENMHELKNCIQHLVDRIEIASLNGEESMYLPILITLTNLAVLPDWHVKYTRALRILYSLLDEGTDVVRLQVCKLLVNLSCNPGMVPHLLAAKAPASLLDMLDSKNEDEFLLRFITVLDNIITTVFKHNIETVDLPLETKAPSPETTYAAIYGLSTCERMRKSLFILTSHENEEIRSHAKNGFKCLKD